MPSNSSFPTCLNTPKTTEQIEEELRSHVKRKELISTLPVDNSCPRYPLRCYQGFWFPEAVLPGVIALKDNHFTPDPTDIFLVTYPKSGTTWLKALAFAISVRGANHHHHQHPLLHRHPQECSPYLEGLFSVGPTPNLDVFHSPRLLATHIPYSCLPETVRTSVCRIVYLCRDPKDTVVSMWHFAAANMTEGAAEPMIPFAEAFELMCAGRSAYGPVWEQILEYWMESLQRPEKVMFLRYEEMMEDPAGWVRRVAGFIGQPFTEAEERDGAVEEIVRMCSFERLSGLVVNQGGTTIGKEIGWNIKGSSFFRKGKVGDWREHLTPEMADKLDCITQQKLDGSGLSFRHASG